MAQGTGQRGGFGTEGPRADRVQRSGPPERDRDLETEVEDEMRASGRAHIRPREGLVGAHDQRREATTGDVDDRMYEPEGAGAEVTPAPRAAPAGWNQRAGAWLRQHRRALTVVAGGAVIAGVAFMTAARARN